MKGLQRLSNCFVLLMTVAVWTSAGRAAPIDDLVKGAKQEGTIEFYAPSTLTPQGAQALAAAFNKKYGLNVKLQYSPSGNMTRDIGKVVGLGATGVPPEWDLLVVTDAHHATLLRAHGRQVFRVGGEHGTPKAVVEPVANRESAALVKGRRWPSLNLHVRAHFITSTTRFPRF